MTIKAECTHCQRQNEVDVDDSVFNQPGSPPVQIEVECGYNDCHETFYIFGQITDSLAGE
jgi:hypothetical protein